MTKSLFAQNVLGLLLVLCIAFIVDFFPRPHVEWFQSTEVRQFCPRLRLIGRSVEIIISHVVDIVDTFFSYSNEIKAKSIFV